MCAFQTKKGMNFIMEERYKSRIIVDLLISRKNENGEEEILLALRKNTGYRDGEYELAGGHVDEGEDLIGAMIREAKEELKINIERKDLTIVHILHHYKGGALKFIIKANRYGGKLEIGEPDKCEELKWFKVTDLPENMKEKIKEVIIEIYNGVFYDNSDFLYLTK